MKKIIETLDLKIKDSKLLELIRTNVKVLGEVALCVGFERWEAILPNTCYRLPFFRNDY